MSDPPSLSTGELHLWVDELRGGRPDAAGPTLRKIVARVEGLARGMFRKFPRVGRFVDADDVVQNTLIRLLRALEQVRPDSTRHFYALAGALIRRELLDLVRHYYGPRGDGANLAAAPLGDDSGEIAPPAAGTACEAELDKLAAFHEAVERLPAEQREVFGLVYYHGWPLADIAGLLGVSVRTVQRWQADALEALRKATGPG